MIIAPIKEGSEITQAFGKTPYAHLYEKWGFEGHNGQDIALFEGTSIYAPVDGKVIIREDPDGFGLHIKLEGHSMNEDGDYRVMVLAHLSKTIVEDGVFVQAGDEIAKSGNTGNSSGPHLHWGYYLYDSNGNRKNRNNGYGGAVDIFEKGWISQHAISFY